LSWRRNAAVTGRLPKGDPAASAPFNVACGRCRTCQETNTGVCLTVNPGRAGGAYGYVNMGGRIGGQARYVMIPYADFNLLRFPDKDRALSKIMDLTMLTDILPTGFHGALNAGVKPGSTVYVAGAGPCRAAGRSLLPVRARRRPWSPTDQKRRRLQPR
jgi:glutathione-independent formaldehyde dehydrogenase